MTGAPPPSEAGDRALLLEVRPIAPNPAEELIVIRFALPGDGPARLDLLGVTGRRIATISDIPRQAGVHEVRWSRGRQPNGVYFVRLRAGGLTEVRNWC